MKLADYKNGREAVRLRSFESWGDFLSWSEGPGEEKHTDSRSSRSPEERGGWYGSDSYAEAMHLARFGWPDGRKLIDGMTAQLESVSRSFVARQEVQYSVAGDCVDVGRYVTGEPENMMVFEEQEVRGAGKLVSVLINISASAAITPKEMMMRGAAALALVDCLENAGRSCEIVLATAQCRSGLRLENHVVVKAAGEPVDMDMLAFAAAHPSSYRRLFFASWENEKEKWRHGIGAYGHMGYGMPTHSTEASADIVVPHMLGLDGAKLLQWVKDELRRQGFEIEA